MEELSLQMTRQSSILPQSGTGFTYERGGGGGTRKEPQRLNVDLPQPGLETGTL